MAQSNTNGSAQRKPPVPLTLIDQGDDMEDEEERSCKVCTRFQVSVVVSAFGFIFVYVQLLPHWTQP